MNKSAAVRRYRRELRGEHACAAARHAPGPGALCLSKNARLLLRKWRVEAAVIIKLKLSGEILLWRACFSDRLRDVRISRMRRLIAVGREAGHRRGDSPAAIHRPCMARGNIAIK